MTIDLTKVKTRERKLLARKEAIESDLKRAQRERKDAERRLDSKRKIVLGGVVLKAVREGLIPEASIRKMIDRLASDRDKNALEDLDFEAPKAAENVASVPTPTASDFKRE